MTNRQDGKAIVLEFFAALESSAHGELAENWIFIDFLHYLLLLGVDVLERCRTISRS
jgi:hypothetical protein